MIKSSFNSVPISAWGHVSIFNSPLFSLSINWLIKVEEQLEENKLDMNGVYSVWDENPYKSELGLDGRTK